MTMDCPSCAAPIERGADACLACGRSLSTLALGSVLANRYELHAVLGRGGMGLVYRAFDRLLEEEVAIKVLRTDLSANAEAMRRFRSEIKLARKVSHPNVCRIHDYGEEGPLGYISMEILTGQDLQKTLSDHPRGLPEAEALSDILQIASGLQAIHDVGILHRDLKTANASRDERGVVRLVDFGIAKDLQSRGQTAGGESFGTPEYMSPEQCRGDALDFRSDVYALGILAYELFTGELPIRGATPMATLFKQVQEAPSFDGEPGSRVPRRLVPVLRKALAKAAHDRHASAQEFAQALRDAAMGDGPVALTTSPTAVVGQADATPPRGPNGVVEPQTRTWGPGQKDARRDERIYLPTDVFLRKLGPSDIPQKEERTVAHDLSRSGMRVLTSWSDLDQGDKVKVVEVGGDFATAAIVRNVNRGADHITRAGIEFVEKQAPDRLVGTTTSGRRPADGNTPRPMVSLAIERTATVSSPPSVSRGSGNVVGSAPQASGIREGIAEARRLANESRIWEALQCLETAHGLAKGTPDAVTIRIMIAETQAVNPALSGAARQNLEDLARTEPREPAVHAALARIYRSAGMIAQSHEAFARVLALDPSDREARTAIVDLENSATSR